MSYINQAYYPNNYQNNYQNGFGFSNPNYWNNNSSIDSGYPQLANNNFNNNNIPSSYYNQYNNNSNNTNYNFNGNQIDQNSQANVINNNFSNMINSNQNNNNWNNWNNNSNYQQNKQMNLNSMNNINNINNNLNLNNNTFQNQNNIDLFNYNNANQINNPTNALNNFNQNNSSYPQNISYYSNQNPPQEYNQRNNNKNDIYNENNLKFFNFNYSNKNQNFVPTNPRQIYNSNSNNNKIYNNINLLNYQNNDVPNNTSNNSNEEQNNNGFINNSFSKLSPKTMVAPARPIKVELDFFIRARGLDNVGATCYMNATLQSFYHVKELSENIINDNQINSNLKLTFCFKDLIENLAGCKNKKKFYSDKINLVTDEYTKDSFKPIKFKDLISDMNPLFKGVQANDSKDLILFLLETMDKELTLRNNKTSQMEIFVGDSIEDLKPENFKKYHNSIFSDIFYGFQKSVIKCKRCGNEISNFSVMNFIIFPLEKIYNDINKQKNLADNNNMIMNNYYMNNNMYGYMNYNNYKIYNNYDHSNLYNNFRTGINNNRNNLNPMTTVVPRNRNMNININNDTKKKLSLYDCFKNNKNSEELTGANQIYCNPCQSNQDGVMFDEIHQAPNVLIIILNRGKGNTFKCELDFPKDLDLSQYISNPESPKLYELIAVISHLGESSMEGHFIAYCKHFDGSWYLFNDSIAKQDEGKGVYNGIPYILFYQKKNVNQ